MLAAVSYIIWMAVTVISHVCASVSSHGHVDNYSAMSSKWSAAGVYTAVNV